jgi:hypothetical protein
MGALSEPLIAAQPAPSKRGRPRKTNRADGDAPVCQARPPKDEQRAL